MTPEQVESMSNNDSYSTPGTENEKGYGPGSIIANNFLLKYNGRLEIKSSIEEDSCGTLVTAYFSKF